VGHEIISLGSSSESDSIAHTNAQAEMESMGRSSADSFSSATSSGSSDSLINGSSEIYGEEYGNAFMTPDMQGMSISNVNGSVSTMSTSTGSSHSNASSSAQGKSKAQARTTGVTHSKGTSQTLRPVFKMYGNTYSMPEQEMMFAQALGAQEDRFAFVRTRDGSVYNIKTFDVKKYEVSQFMIDKTTSNLISESTYFTPRYDIENTMKNRHFVLLGNNKNIKKEFNEDDYFE